MTHRRYPSYPDDTDYTTNAPSYYDDLARKAALIKELAERIWGYEETLNLTLSDIAQRFIEWDSKIAAFDGDVNVLLQEWIADGTFDQIINVSLFNDLNVKIDRNSLYQSIINGKTMLQGHGTKYGVNNTLHAFEYLASLGDYKTIEADIHMTSDGVWVCTHDEDISINTDGTGNVSSMTFAQLQVFNVTKLGNNISKLPNLKIPKVSDFIDICLRNNVIPVMEIKCVMNETKYASLITLLKEKGVESNSILMSFNQSYITRLRELSDITLVWLLDTVNPLLPEHVDYGVFIKNMGIGVFHTNLTKENCKLAHANEVFILAWTIQYQFQLEDVFEKGANIIGTDNVLWGDFK